ncbi:hypothetical protein [Micromonospora sp. NPDC049900]
MRWRTDRPGRGRNSACTNLLSGYCDGLYVLTWRPALAVLLSLTVGSP